MEFNEETVQVENTNPNEPVRQANKGWRQAAVVLTALVTMAMEGGTAYAAQGGGSDGNRQTENPPILAIGGVVGISSLLYALFRRRSVRELSDPQRRILASVLDERLCDGQKGVTYKDVKIKPGPNTRTKGLQGEEQMAEGGMGSSKQKGVTFRSINPHAHPNEDGYHLPAPEQNRRQGNKSR